MPKRAPVFFVQFNKAAIAAANQLQKSKNADEVDKLCAHVMGFCVRTFARFAFAQK